MVVTVLCLAVGRLAWAGFVLSKLWGWFIAYSFNAPILSLNGAIGVMLVVSFLTHKESDNKDITAELVGRAANNAVFTPAVALGIGWIVHLFA
jgi:hypothetical protein